MKTTETGPIYGVTLLETMPLDGGTMRQALPSRRDLDDCRKAHFNGCDRLVAGYEVLLEHFYRLKAGIETLRPLLDKCVDAENQLHGIRGTAMAKRTIRDIQAQIARAIISGDCP